MQNNINHNNINNENNNEQNNAGAGAEANGVHQQEQNQQNEQHQPNSGRAFTVAISALPCIVILLNNNNNEQRALALLRNVLSSLGDLHMFNHFAQFIDSIGHIRQAVELLEQGNAAESVGRIETAHNLLEGLQQHLQALLVAAQQQPQHP